MTAVRVVVTGVGLLTPLGSTIDEFARSLRDGAHGFRTVPYFDTTDYPIASGAVLGARPAALDELAVQHPEWETAELYGVHCARVALADAGLAASDVDPFRVGVAMASSNAGVETNHRHAQSLHSGRARAGETVVRTPATVSAAIRSDLGLRGPQAVVSTACAAGSNSIGMGFDMIRGGSADVVLAGGAEPFSELSFSGFTLLKSLSPTRLRPFDQDRDGTALGEAACVLVLESAERARARGARVIGEILGYGISDDAYHATAPDPSGEGAALAIRQCMREAGLTVQDIDYVNAHGTGTRYNDVMELTALSQVLGDRLGDVPVSSTKSLHGHTLSCAGSIEALACLIALDQGFVPGNATDGPTLEEFPTARLPLSSLGVGELGGRLEVALSNSFGFGGNNTCIAVGSAGRVAPVGAAV